MRPELETRSFVGGVEVREREDGSATIRGLAAVFDKRSENLGGFREVIEPGAFDNTDMSDVRGLFNHDSNFVLGRTTSETLSVKQTKRGLEYEIDLPGTQTIRDLVLEPIKRGDVTQSSFGFIVGQGNDSWDEDDEGVLIRTIRAVNELFDVSPVTFPAYADTTVGTRSMERWQQERADAAEALRKRNAEHIERDRFLRSTEIPGLIRR